MMKVFIIKEVVKALAQEENQIAVNLVQVNQFRKAKLARTQFQRYPFVILALRCINLTIFLVILNKFVQMIAL